MEDIITIESAISETELAIEQLTGTLRHYDALVDFATVTISLQEVYQLSNVEEPATTFGERLAAAFASGWHGFVSALESFAVALAYGWVWVLLLAVIAAAVLRLLWRSRHPKGKPQDRPGRRKSPVTRTCDPQGPCRTARPPAPVPRARSRARGFFRPGIFRRNCRKDENKGEF